MKSIYLSAFAAAALLFTACSSDESTDQNDSQTGAIQTTLTFDGIGDAVKAASTAVPETSWANNIKQVQMFLYPETGASAGKVAYSAVINPTSTGQTFTWTNVPPGTYKLALVANAKSSSDPLTTTINGAAAVWSAYNVKNFVVNTSLDMSLKQNSVFAGPYNAHKQSGDKPCSPMSEVFTAYASGVVVTNGATTDLTGSPLALKREVSMMRVRINSKAVTAPEKTPGVSFNNASTSILIHRNPVALNFQLGSNNGGISSAASDKDLIIEAAGSSTFNTTNPTTGYGSGTIVDADFTLWRDMIIMPNLTAAEVAAATSEQVAASGTATAARRYFIVVSANAPAGYILDNGTTLTTAKPVYWYGVIDGAFVSNNIREVNLTLKSSGTDNPPVDPTEEGGLIIKVAEPIKWNSNIQSTNKDL